MVGLVLVSHSRTLATAVKELVVSMSGTSLRVVVAAGVGKDRAELGTDATEILEAIQSAMSEEGVLVLMDIGSAILSTEAALEFLDESKRAKVRCCGAPFVEGAVSAGVAATLGLSLDEVAREAAKALRHKSEHFGDRSDEGENVRFLKPREKEGEFLATTVTVRNHHGFHARPAARFIREAARHAVETMVRNLSNGRGPVSAQSMSALASLQILQGHEIQISARGPGAETALTALRAAVKAGLGENADLPEPPAPATGSKDGEMPQRHAPVAVSAGIAIGEIFIASKVSTDLPIAKAEDTASEREKLRKAIEKARIELARDEQSLRQSLGKEEAEIFRAQALVLEDPALVEAAERSIHDDNVNAALAWQKSYQAVVNAYQGLEDEYMRQRAADIEDMGIRVLAALGIRCRKVSPPPRPGILVADDLTPADVADLSKELVLGVICLKGGKTSHAAILLRARGIPAVANAEPVFEQARLEPADGPKIAAFDGESGELWLNPATGKLSELRERQERLRKEIERLRHRSHEQAITKDGHAFAVLANLGRAREAGQALENGADGIGLFRTEFLFLDRDDAPGEEEQFEALRELQKAMELRPVVVRTLDIGGDKNAPSLGLPQEANPFLGVRGIRLCLQRHELFQTHLRAILRGGHGGNFRIMFPMISELQELRDALSELRTAHLSLESDEKPHVWPISVGVMVEVPAAAILIDQLAQVVDFFSIGTNDLTQYLLASDRDHPHLGRFQDALHPAVLRSISRLTRIAHRHGKHVGVCGEAASDPLAATLLLGLGVDDLSLAPALIPKIKDTIRSSGKPEMHALARKAQRLGTAAEVRAAFGVR